MEGMQSRARALVTGVAVVAALAGCSATAPGEATREVVTVFAAASLTDVFGELETQFEAANPGVDVVISFGGSSALAEQLVQGAPAEIFAAASPATMAIVVDAGVATGPTIFATNELQIAVPVGNPGSIVGLADFARDDALIAVCAVEAPCGAVASATFEAAGITAAPDTLEQDVRAVLTKVVLGEVDAGLVYRTDVIVAGDSVEGIEIVSASDPRSQAILDASTTDYPIVALPTASETATKFLSFVLGVTGVRILAEAGFGSR
jgi:molybdate transport system substrate-binding protein